MKATRAYILLAIATLLAMGLVVWMAISTEQTYYIIASEVIVAVVIALLVNLYLKTIKPLYSIINGVDLLRAQDFNSRLKRVNQKEIDQIVDLFNKMLRQLKEERMEAREKNELLNVLINASPMGVVMLDLDGNISLINPSAATILECPASTKTIDSIDNILASELKALQKNSSKVVHLNDGNIFKCTHSTFVASGFNHSFYLIEKMTEELLFAERKAYEKVIRMIAHEVNNSMAGVSSSIDMVASTFTESGDIEVVDILSMSAERCINLSQFISKFADVVKIPEPVCHKFNFNELITNNSKLYESLTIGRDIKIIISLSEQPLIINADVAQMEQVILNIIKNSIEAIDDSGEIIINTSTDTNKITISNNGRPIAPETEQHLFTPFYSTKPYGQGIGLMVIREILTQHGYRFALKTNKQGLTSFTIRC